MLRVWGGDTYDIYPPGARNPGAATADQSANICLIILTSNVQLKLLHNYKLQ
jgi:hypothetical protein